MKRATFIPIALVLLSIFAVGCNRHEEPIETITARVMRLAEKKYLAMNELMAATDVPRSVDKGGELLTSNIYWWTSGFYAGSLWYIYSFTQSEDIRLLAESYTEMLSPLQWVTTDHDIGFQLNCSYGNGLRYGERKEYRDVLVNGAHSLASRFNSTVGSLRSWDNDRWSFPVIIDNMMNLELLVEVANFTADSSLMAKAVDHAYTTMHNHYRADFSSYHLVDYDPQTGEVKGKQTVQGYSDSSAWSRGQSWGLYGFTMMYRATGRLSFLWQAQNVADYLIDRLPDDAIPYWDYDDPAIPNALRDASAAAIMASALAELATLADNGRGGIYRRVAERQVRRLASADYLAPEGENCGFLLRHSVGSLPAESEVDVPLTYTDYYFLEALLRLKGNN